MAVRNDFNIREMGLPREGGHGGASSHGQGGRHDMASRPPRLRARSSDSAREFVVQVEGPQGT